MWLKEMEGGAEVGAEGVVEGVVRVVGIVGGVFVDDGRLVGWASEMGSRGVFGGRVGLCRCWGGGGWISIGGGGDVVGAWKSWGVI